MSAVHLIINPTAGAASRHALIDALANRLRSAGLHVHLHPTTGKGDAARYARQLGPETRAVVVCGGDGTISEVIDGLIEHPIPISIFPVGTENLLAKDLGFRPADPEQLFHTVLQGRWHEMDVGVVNGKRFLMVAGAGFDGDVVAAVHADRRGHIDKFSYFGPLWRTFWTYRFPPLRVVVDGTVLFSGRGLVFVGNIRRYAVGLRLLAHAHRDDGLLDVCVFPASDQFQLLWHSAVTAVGLHPALNRAPYAQGRQVRVESLDGPIALEVDGDPAGQLPADFSVLPRAARILLPAAR